IRSAGGRTGAMGPAPAAQHLRRAAAEPEVVKPALEDRVQGEKKMASRKRPRAGSPAEGLLQPVKLSREELYKEPTNEELNRLRETEILFHSSLLRLQVEELLKEVRLSEKKKDRIDVFLREVNQRIKKVPSTPEAELTDQTWLPAGVRVPLHQVPYAVKGSFRFLPPAQVTVVGSYLLGTCTRPDINVDMALTMPREILQDKDLLNQRYFRKRALYLAHLAHHLAQDPLFGSVRFSYANGCHLKPLLLLRPHGKDERLVTVRLHPCPPPDFFRPCRLLPTKNNVRSAWYLGQSHPGDEPPTPHYNTWLLRDTALESHAQLLSAVLSSAQGLKDGVALLKVWLRQRELDRGLGGFNGFLISMLVAFLVSTRKIHTTLSGYQVLRSVLQFLATTDLSVTGISLCPSAESSLPALADFHQAFPVVFLDSSGRLNLCADVTASTYHQVQHEARLSMVLLDSKADDGFQLLLMTPKPMVRSFDHILHVRPVSRLQAACHRLKLCAELQDSGGDYVSAVLGPLMTLLEQGLGSRLQLLAHSRPPVPEWDINQDPPKHKDSGALTLGLLLQPEGLASVLQLGPEADQPEAADFRRFWGSRSELRRFQDGAIREAVVWEAASLHQKRLIPHQVVTHLLALHADIPDACVHYVGGFLDALIQGPKEDGFVFRIRVAYQREPQILREVQSPEGVVSLRDTPAALRLERDTKHLPLLTSALHGLQQQHPAFSGAARLAKRWVRAQLLGEGFTDESLDLLAAALFLHPEPFTPPSSPQVGFLRFLSLVSTFDWKNNPLIVNLNNELTAEEQAEIRSGFLAARTRLPVMVLLTPQDRKSSVWTQDGPSAQILQQLVTLAAEALPILEKQLMDPWGPGDIRTVFRPPLDIYDVLIRLSPRHVPRHRQAVDCPAASFCRGQLREPGPSSLMPVLGFDPPQLYLAQLREAFGDLALFFYDQHGGEVIGVLWKPTSFQPQPFKASIAKGRMVVSQGEEMVMVPNVEAILEDFAVLGEGLVQAVEARSERWTV
uniref:Nucleolar protein 6 n=1 Tax=Chinchilla lanigera TaxID=34839 RepID=A0A8C2UM31_CHILA